MRTKTRQDLAALQASIDHPKQGKNVNGSGRIEQGADLVITGNLLDAKHTPRITAPLAQLYGVLVGQEGGALGEKDGKGAHPDIDHLILSVLPGAHVGELPTVLFELSDQMG